MANILVVDDEPKMTSLICGHLEDAGHSVMTTVKPAEALKLIQKHSFDIVITDLSMPEISGMQVMEAAIEKGGTEVIMMTAYGSVETAVEAMKKGAADYLLKPFPLDELQLVVGKIIEKQKATSLSRHYREVVDQAAYTDFIGDSPTAQKVKELIVKVAPSDATVLLMGKSGTGKEVAARMLHNLSPRKDMPFIAVNCAALTETLLESELFGHEKGAFTGAVARKQGRFELAEGGTIFLDEIAETSPGLQSKLLRVLEERTLVRVGGVDSIDVDVRVVAATNRDLKEEIERAVILAGGEPLSVEDFALQVDDSPIVETDAPVASSGGGLESAEKRMILSALEKTGGNKTEAARLLKITRRRLYSRMKVHNIQV